MYSMKEAHSWQLARGIIAFLSEGAGAQGELGVLYCILKTMFMRRDDRSLKVC